MSRSPLSSLQRFTIQVLACATITSCNVAQRSTEIVVEPSEVFVGLLTRGTSLRYEIEIHNNSDQPITNLALGSSCYCTAAFSGQNTIPAGGAAPVQVTIDTTFLDDGPFESTVRLHSGGEPDPLVTVQFRGAVRSEFLIEPNVIDFGVVALGTQSTKTVMVSRTDGSVSKVTSASSSIPGVYVQVSDSREGAVILTVSVLRDERSWISGNIVLETDSASLPFLRIPVQGHVRESN